MKSKAFPLFLALALLTGVCGAYLRAGQLELAYDPASGILKSGEPVTMALISACFVAAAIALIASIILRKGAETGAKLKNTALRISLCASAAVVLAYAGMVFFSLRLEFEVTRLILALLSVYTSVAFISFAKYSLRERDSFVYSVFAAVPSVWACFVLILAFRGKASDPIIANYVPLVFAYISIIFFCYAIAAHLLGRDKRYVAVFSCLFGVFFIVLNLLAPVFAGELITVDMLWIEEALPQLAFLILMPAATAKIIRK